MVQKRFINSLARALYEASQDAPKTKRDSLVQAAVQLLKRKGLLRQSAGFFSALEQVRNREENIVLANVTTAFPLSTAERNHIVETVHTSTKKTVELQETIDPSVVGGIKIRYEDSLFDATLTARIASLKNHLTTNSN